MISLILIHVPCFSVLSFIVFWNSKVVCMCERVCLCIDMVSL